MINIALFRGSRSARYIALRLASCCTEQVLQRSLVGTCPNFLAVNSSRSQLGGEFVASYAKRADHREKKLGGDKKQMEEEASEPPKVTFTIQDYDRLMRNALDQLQKELSGMRTGRAHPGLLEPVEVEIQGAKRPLSACASVSAKNAQVLSVTVYNESTLGIVAKAIKESPLKLESRIEGDEILVSVPRPTKQGIENMIKLCHQEVEKAKVAIRQARHKALERARKALDSEEEKKRAEKEVQKLHDKFIAEVDGMKQAKDKDLRANL